MWTDSAPNRGFPQGATISGTMIPSLFATPWVPGIGILLVLELLFVLLSKFDQRPRPVWTYHLWALSLALATVLSIGQEPDSLAWRVVASLATLLTAIVGVSLVDSLLIQRPWAPEKGSSLPKLARDVLRTGVLVAAVLIVATSILDYPLPAVLVSSTVLSAVIGLALQDVLKNVFAGMALEIERPFSRGDWLLVDGVAVEVLDTSWRSVRLRSNEGVEFYEPNSNLSTTRLVNYGSGRQPIALSFTVGLPYDVPPAKVKRALEAAARSVPDSPKDHPPAAFVAAYSESSVEYRLRVWTHEVSALTRFKDTVYSRIWYELRRQGLSVPFPTRTLHLQQEESSQQTVETQQRREQERLLSGLSLFRDFDREDIRSLCQSVRRAPYDDGEILVHEGDSGDSLFVVVEGRVIVSKSGQGLGTGEIRLASLHSGTFFGEMSLLTGEPRSATVRADGPCDVLVLTRRHLAPLLQDRPELAEVLSAALVERQAQTEATVQDRRDRPDSASSPEGHHSLLGKIRTFFRLNTD